MSDVKRHYPIEDFQPRPLDGPIAPSDVDGPGEAAATREVPPFLQDWNEHRGARVRVLTGAGLVFTGRLDAVIGNSDGSLHSVKMGVESIAAMHAMPLLQREPARALCGKAATLPGAQVVLIEFAD